MDMPTMFAPTQPAPLNEISKIVVSCRFHGQSYWFQLGEFASAYDANKAIRKETDKNRANGIVTKCVFRVEAHIIKTYDL